ncbi:peroxidase [Salvia divinorum]|uniref:Peroxidase n=1 Tax=Salvia divinorum TaxID=28513 RepID=A0ABD1GHT1_SALDI
MRRLVISFPFVYSETDVSRLFIVNTWLSHPPPSVWLPRLLAKSTTYTENDNLKAICPTTNSTVLDLRSPNTFDNEY